MEGNRYDLVIHEKGKHAKKPSGIQKISSGY